MDVRKIDHVELKVFTLDGESFEVDYKGKNTFHKIHEIIRLMANGMIEFKR